MGALDGHARVALTRVAPFAGACVLGWIVVPTGASVDWWEYWLSLGVALGAGALAFAAIRTKRQVWLAVIPSALMLLAGVGLLRDCGGGLPTGAGALAILPVFQVALYSRSRRDLAIILAAVALFFLVPIWLVGSPDYPNAQYRTVLLAVVADAIIGFTVQGLVGRVRDAAIAARSQTQMLERVSTIVHGLFDSTRPRDEVCEAALLIGSAQAAVLFEPGSDPSRLTCTAFAGFGELSPQPPVPRSSPAYRALDAGEPLLLTDGVETHVGLPDLWASSGRPSSLLYQPLVHRGQRLGVLVVGWSDRVRAEGPRATAIGLLAHEAAAVIARADAMTDLSDAALSDELTGLPNRRAWQQHLIHAFRDDRRITIAVLDLDHFKQFNDTRGHPVGDLLLKETAAAWRDQLRPDDFLARVGGEEFGLLLLDCEPATSMRIITRLREAVAYGQTCSAGVAERRTDEILSSVIARADRALYDAKASGRDTTRLAGSDDEPPAARESVAPVSPRAPDRATDGHPGPPAA